MRWRRLGGVALATAACAVDVDQNPDAFGSASGGATTVSTTTQTDETDTTDETDETDAESESESTTDDDDSSGSSSTSSSSSSSETSTDGESETPDDCGDGIKNGAEQCDGDDLGGWGCTQLGWDQGTLECDVNCVYDTSGCEDAPCKSQGEACSGADDCCNSGCGKGGAVCIMNNQNVCCT